MNEIGHLLAILIAFEKFAEYFIKSISFKTFFAIIKLEKKCSNKNDL